jgi:hypothetical protein
MDEPKIETEAEGQKDVEKKMCKNMIISQKLMKKI